MTSSNSDQHWFWRLIGLDDDPDEFDRSILLPYQNFMVEKVKDHEILFLAAEMGLGKTVAVLTAIRELLDEGKIEGPVLIVAPLRVAEETWPTEIVKWAHTRSLTFTLIRGTAPERKALLKQKTDLHIVNREMLPWLRKALAGRWPYRMLVYDEASRLKGGKKRTAKAKRLKKDGTLGTGRRISEFGTLTLVRPFIERVIELSGTPAPKGLHDLWGPFYIMDQGERLGRSMTAFDQRWFDTDRYTWETKPKEHAFDEIMGLVSDVMVSLKEADYLTLPPRIDNPVWVTLPPRMMQAYRKFERTLYLEDYDIEALTSGVLTNKLLQYANGSIYDENGDDQFVHDFKLRALESIMEEAAGEPVLVAYEFKFDLKAIRKRWPKAVMIGEKNWLQRWENREIEMMICHPASASHGLNLQFGGSIGVWYGLTWSLELFQQFIKRLHRTGQKADRVFMHYILVKSTADEDVWNSVHKKGATQERITDAVRVRLESIT